jgi:hypothetical protein
LRNIEKAWEEKRAKAKAEKVAYQEEARKVKEEHDKKINAIYQQERDRLAKEKEAEENIEEIKKAKEQAKRDVYGLSPQEQEEKRKKRAEKFTLAKKIAFNIFNPKKEYEIMMGKDVKRRRRKK